MLLFAGLVAGSFSFGALAAPHIGPAAVNILRFVLGALVMGAAAFVLLKGRMPPPVAPWRYAVLGGLMAVFFITMFVALRITDPVSTGAVFTLMPHMAADLGYLILSMVPRGIVVASLVLAAIGAVCVIFDGSVDAILAFRIGTGELIFLFGAACHAAYVPLVRRFNRGEPVVVFTFWTLVATGLWIAV